MQDLLNGGKVWRRSASALLRLSISSASNGGRASELHYWVRELTNQVERLEQSARPLTAWVLPDTRNSFRRLASSTPDLRTAPKSRSKKYRRSRHRCAIVYSRTGSAGHGDGTALELIQNLQECGAKAAELLAFLQQLSADSEAFVSEMDFRFLYNSERKLLSVGCDPGSDTLHRSWYDLLASEARTAQFIAIAKGDVPQESWFHLGRGHVIWRGERVLLSWTGTMFEYLMPFLWMRPYSDTILERSASAAVRVQREFTVSHEKNFPWGISEAACAERNSEGDYLYHPFGVPPLALKPRGVDEPDVNVVAPYATFLALSVDLEAALPNLRAMEARDLDRTIRLL